MSSDSGHTSPDTIARSNNKYPILCQRCSGLFTVQDGGPDSGRIFTCGICVENMEQGTMAFSCSYFDASPMAMVEDKMFCHGSCMCQQEEGTATCKKPIKPIAPVIDAEELQRSLRAIRSIEEVAAPGYREPSPHPFMDDIVSRINEEQTIIKKASYPFGYYVGRMDIRPETWGR